jgi:outer membrane receptor protein involved in Fe transport
MKKNIHIYLFCYFCFLSANAFSQSAYTVKAKVVDENNNAPVSSVNISVVGVAHGASTDSLGYFSIVVDSAVIREIVVSHINYRKKIINISQFASDPNLVIYIAPKQEMINDVVVTASLYGQPRNKLAKPVAIIQQKEIKDNFHSNVIDVLAITPGFAQVWEYHSPLILRGLNSKRLVIMKNGCRRIGTFPGGYFAQDMNIYDIKKIEVIKGPGSVIYGSGAISGIINVIGHSPFGTGQTKVNSLTGYGSNNNEFLQQTSVCHKKQNFGFQVNAKYRKTADMIYGNGEIAENSNVEDRDFSLSTGFRLSSKQTIKLNADYHYGNWGKPRGFNGATKRFTKIRNKESNLHTNLDYTYRPKGFVEQLSMNLYYDNGERDYYKYKYSEITNNVSALELVNYKDQYGGGRIFSIVDLTGKSRLTVGADAYAFRLNNPARVIDYYNRTEGVLEGSKGAGQQNAGAYLLNETQVGEQLKLIAGLRCDYAEVLEGKGDALSGRSEIRSALSGNFGLVLSFNPSTHLSANAGRAFRMPTAEEMFAEVISCKGIKQGNPKLKPEYSWNYDVGIRGRLAQNLFQYDLALFCNFLDDFISEIQATETEGVDFTFKNTDAVICGGELSSAYRFQNVLKPGNVLYAGMGASYIYGIDKFVGNDAPLFGIPPFKLSFDLKYRGLVNRYWLTGYTMKFQTAYAAEQNRVPAVDNINEAGPWGYVPSDPHTVFDFAFGLNSNALPGHPKLRFIVKNIFNVNYQPYGSFIPAMGRNFKTTLSFNIN